MICRAVVFSLLVILVTFTWADVQKVDRLLQEKRFKELADELNSLNSREQSHSTALFARALITTDGKSAHRLYNDLVQKDHSSKYADQAIFRIAQYHYLTKNYKAAKGYFSLLSRHYDDSQLKDDAQYMYCQCLLAQGAVDSAKLFLRTFVKNVRHSPFVDLAVLDLEDLEQANVLDDQEVEAMRFSIQVGAFSNRDNAKRFADTLTKRNIPADIVEKRIGRQRLYAVWVGRFSSRESARSYAGRHLANIIDDYQIVDRKDSN